MYERDLNNRDKNDTVVTMPPPADGEGDSTNRYRSKVRRNGTTSLEIEIPRHGGTCCDRCFLLLFFTIPFGMFFGAIVFSVIGVVNHGASGLFPLLIVPFIIAFICFALFSVKSSAFTHINLKITMGDYCIVRTGITWKSFFQIMVIPTHFNDLDSGRFVETEPKRSEYAREVGLQAEIVTHRNKDSNWEDIKLGLISFGQGLKHKELEWLVEQINRFLRETS